MVTDALTRRELYLSSIWSTKLLRNYDIEHYGTWELISHDDSLCLGKFRGSLSDVIDKALTVRNFIAGDPGAMYYGRIVYCPDEAIEVLSSASGGILPEIPAAATVKQKLATNILGYELMCAVTDAITTTDSATITLCVPNKVLNNQSSLLVSVLSKKGYTNIALTDDNGRVKIQFSV